MARTSRNDMGRITTTVRIGSFSEPEHAIVCEALVDTGAYCLTLPSAWKERLGPLPLHREVDLELADRSAIRGVICGPVRIRIDGFREFAGEVLFVDPDPAGSDIEPLVGYLTLESAGIVVDMVGHRLVALEVFDLKSAPSVRDVRLEPAVGDTHHDEPRHARHAVDAIAGT